MRVKIGYPCINYSVPCRGNRTFRLASYSEDLLIKTVRGNLACLHSILEYNAINGILFFRISSDIIPFASHPVCTFDWQREFGEEFCALGESIREHGMRISMHPDQFVLINALDPGIVERSVSELEYHAAVLDAMGLDESAKIQIHIGGVYGNRTASLARFVEHYRTLPPAVQRRLVIENDDRSYTVKDCTKISRKTGVPVLFDSFHHEVNSSGGTVADNLRIVSLTWDGHDGVPMVDYSSQEPGKRRGNHAHTLNPNHFQQFLQESRGFDLDIMLEIKEKEKAASKALALAGGDARLKR
jgi:UV DNA damage endonuclease